MILSKHGKLNPLTWHADVNSDNYEPLIEYIKAIKYLLVKLNFSKYARNRF